MSDERILKDDEIPVEVRASFELADKFGDLCAEVEPFSALHACAVFTERVLFCMGNSERFYDLYIQILDARRKGRKIIQKERMQ